jgi:endonuclease YncB( thermonuclease family)
VTRRSRAELHSVVAGYQRRRSRRRLGAILVVGALLWLAYLAGRANAAELGHVVKARVVSVHDGDTFRAELVSSHRTVSVRVALIDTPEVGGSRAECYGAAATRNALRVLRPGRVVGLQTWPPAGTTSYNRIVRVVRILETGRTFERWMLRYGYANVYRYRHAALPYESWMAERDHARGHRRGAWGVCPGPNGNGPSSSVFSGWQTGPAPAGVFASTYGLGDGLVGHGLACAGVLDTVRPVIAMRTGACGSRWRVCYRRCIVAVRDDWGPAAWTGRDVDLGPAAAAGVGFAGVGYVRMSPARRGARLGTDRYARSAG